ncbi:hypothetical protein [Pseudonocardia hydrocarbonoxydans]|uniref:Uncharacterized protein n=1 Tax=Pseudonocardia hydrocarbonoxydans TaxID=76726 RepID=A0A4Y3WHK5_9PSEU|nr:hypothetical protein [Pseudonocardia hydrocarbonoxydans]GEC18417.1 hypothetical protein PHY01_07000 [Pseudonocardia hydrocarbonoxydans]
MAEDDPRADEGLAVFRGIWDARRAHGAGPGPGTTRTCRNMTDIGFGGMAGETPEGGSTARPVDDDQRRAWRALLAREGKLVPGATSVRDLVLGTER